VLWSVLWHNNTYSIFSDFRPGACAKYQQKRHRLCRLVLKAFHAKPSPILSMDHKSTMAKKYTTDNRTAVLRFVILLVKTIFITLQVPPVMAPLVASGVLFIGALCFSIIGLRIRERIFAPYFTCHDVALWLLTIATPIAYFIDLEALDTILTF